MKVILNHNRDHRMDFGRYKGKPIMNVPNRYLIWMLKDFNIDYWVKLAEKELEYRNQNDIVIEGKSSADTFYSFWDDMDYDYWDSDDIVWGNS